MFKDIYFDTLKKYRNLSVLQSVYFLNSLVYKVLALGVSPLLSQTPRTVHVCLVCWGICRNNGPKFSNCNFLCNDVNSGDIQL